MSALAGQGKEMTFDLWLADLAAILKREGSPYGEGSIAETTGVDAWRGYFDDDYSPWEAFTEDRTYWEDDGA